MDGSGKGKKYRRNECKNQVDGIKNPKFRKFYNLSEAEEFVRFWKDKPSSPNKLSNVEQSFGSPNVPNINTTQIGCCKASNAGRVQADDPIYFKAKAENETLDVKNLQEKISKCEKKIDFFINGLSTILSGFKEIKNEIGEINYICTHSGSKEGKLSKTRDSKPGLSKEISTGFDSEDGKICKDTSESEGITIGDFDFPESDISGTPTKRKRSSSEDDTDKDESSKRNKVSRAKSEKDLLPFITDEDNYVAVYTDGCCLSNGYSNAKAGIGIWFGEDHPLNVSKPFSGTFPTNNNAEIQAARVAIEIALKANISKLKIITDSSFLINSATKWIQKWKLNGWRADKNRCVVNKVELEKLDKVMSLLSVRWEKVSGHTGIKGNEAADRLANKGAALYVKNVKLISRK